MRNQNLVGKKLTAMAMALTFLIVSSSATRVEAAPTPDLTSQQIEGVIEEVFAGLVSFDTPRVMNHFADDAVVEDPVGTPLIQGKQAIAAYVETFPVLFSHMKLYSLDVKVGGQEVGVKWRLRSRRRPDIPSSSKASATSSSTSRGRFKRRKSSLIWRTF